MWDETQRIFLDSLARMLHAAARQLPGVVAMLLFVALAVAVAAALHRPVQRACARLALDRRLREWGVVPAGLEGRGPSLLVARALTWTVLGILVLAIVSGIDAGSISVWAGRALAFVPRLFAAALVLVVGLAASRVVERSALIGAVNMGLHSARLLGLGGRWLVVILSFAIALDQLGIGGPVVPISLGILFGGVVLALALAVGLGAKDLVARSLDRHFHASPHPLEEAGEDGGELHHL
ncbi:mechanosensitive ion channel family protein [Anaeromyxobacter paludicola]|uniref:Uncharacterized protein n=1 Tax=Anaeromyxobacter paludicola TaxID=2918171 RepID=A0ABM7XEB0_9BACT|nr:hypothetical protein [Anaeromyxobacter paludicola]BDG10221.1 hypothetical protein AMPC_33340 [Anaeromyxobacter paludicola]